MLKWNKDGTLYALGHHTVLEIHSIDTGGDESSPPVRTAAHDSRVLCCVFPSSFDDIILVGTESGAIYTWSLNLGGDGQASESSGGGGCTLLSVVKAHDKRVKDLGVGMYKGMECLVSASSSGVLKVWDVVETMIAPAADADTGVKDEDEDEDDEEEGGQTGGAATVTGVMAVAGAVTGEISERPESTDELFVVETHSRITCLSVCGEEQGGEDEGKKKKKKGKEAAAVAAPAASAVAAEASSKKKKKMKKGAGGTAPAPVPKVVSGGVVKKKKVVKKKMKA